MSSARTRTCRTPPTRTTGPGSPARRASASSTSGPWSPARPGPRRAGRSTPWPTRGSTFDGCSRSGKPCQHVSFARDGIRLLGMSVLRVMGTETEYGISVPGQPGANAMVTSSLVVNAYAAANVPGSGASTGRKARWDFEEETPLRDARGFDLDIVRGTPDAPAADEDLGLAN